MGYCRCNYALVTNVQLPGLKLICRKGHISPILAQLSMLHNFTIESQVQFQAPLAFNPLPLNDAFGISPEDLPVFINSAEWTLCEYNYFRSRFFSNHLTLASSASNDPVLHFVLFVPTLCRPLHILDDTGANILTAVVAVNNVLPRFNISLKRLFTTSVGRYRH